MLVCELEAACSTLVLLGGGSPLPSEFCYTSALVMWIEREGLHSFLKMNDKCASRTGHLA